jgi:hypothetical protein
MSSALHTHNPIITSNTDEIQNTGLTKLINKYLSSKWNSWQQRHYCWQVMPESSSYYALSAHCLTILSHSTMIISFYREILYIYVYSIRIFVVIINFTVDNVILFMCHVCIPHKWKMDLSITSPLWCHEQGNLFVNENLITVYLIIKGINNVSNVLNFCHIRAESLLWTLQWVTKSNI